MNLVAQRVAVLLLSAELLGGQRAPVFGHLNNAEQNASPGRPGGTPGRKSDPGGAPASTMAIESPNEGLLLDTASDLRMSLIMRFEGTLPVGRSASHQLNLSAGRIYSVVAFCDRDCRDPDFGVVQFDRPVGRFVEVRSVPTLRIVANRTGGYVLHITMRSCSFDPCAYAFGVYGTP